MEINGTQGQMLAQETTSDKARPLLAWNNHGSLSSFVQGNMLNHEPKPSTCLHLARVPAEMVLSAPRLLYVFILPSLSFPPTVVSGLDGTGRDGTDHPKAGSPSGIPSVVPSPVSHPFVIIVSLVHRNCARLYRGTHR